MNHTPVRRTEIAHDVAADLGRLAVGPLAEHASVNDLELAHLLMSRHEVLREELADAGV
jgi:hypothetical protein